MNMRHVLEPVDLMVAAGIVAIITGAFLVFVSTQGRFENAAVTDDVAHIAASDAVQPALGHTLVTMFLLEQERSGEIKKAVTRLNQVTMTAQQIDRSTDRQIKRLAEQANNAKASNEARAEFVKGRSVVNFTSRAVKNNSLTDQQRQEYDLRMIQSSAEAAKQIERDFEKTEESNLGRTIVEETQGQMNAAHRNQEEVGAAIVLVTLLQDEYTRAFESEQEQLGLLVSVTPQAQL